MLPHTHTYTHVQSHTCTLTTKKKSGFPGRTKEGTSSSSVCSLVGVMTSQLVFLAGWCATLPLFLMKRTLNMKAIKGKKRGSSSESKEARGALMKKKKMKYKTEMKSYYTVRSEIPAMTEEGGNTITDEKKKKEQCIVFCFLLTRERKKKVDLPPSQPHPLVFRSSRYIYIYIYVFKCSQPHSITATTQVTTRQGSLL